MNRLFEKMSKKELALILSIKGGPHLVPTIAQAGFDCARPDMMHSGIDWRELEHMIRAAQANNLASCVRLATNPWLAGEDNLQLAVDAARAFSIGIDIVYASIASAKQARVLVDASKDWHRSGQGWYPTDVKSMNENDEQLKRTAFACPAIESISAMRDIDAILDIEGMRMVSIACTDLAEMMGHRLQYDHPDVWKFIDRVTKRASDRGIVVNANTGYSAHTQDQIAERIRKLRDHGCGTVLVQGVEHLFQKLAKELISKI